MDDREIRRLTGAAGQRGCAFSYSANRHAMTQTRLLYALTALIWTLPSEYQAVLQRLSGVEAVNLTLAGIGVAVFLI